MYARVDEFDELDQHDDAELVRRAQRGDSDALDRLLARHGDALYRFCNHLVDSREDAEDLYQETVARAIDRVETIQAAGAFRSWLFRVAKNLSVDSFRRKGRLCPLPDEDVSPLPEHGDGPHERVERREEQRTVRQALRQLAESHQRVLMLREVEGLSYADIARRMNVSQSAVETLLFRARRRLREEYSKRDAVFARLGLIGGLRALSLRLAGPVLGNGSIAAKVALTATVVGTVGVAGPRMLPRILPAAHPAQHRVSAAPVFHQARVAARGARRAANRTAALHVAPVFVPPSSPVTARHRAVFSVHSSAAAGLVRHHSVRRRAHHRTTVRRLHRTTHAVQSAQRRMTIANPPLTMAPAHQSSPSSAPPAPSGQTFHRSVTARPAARPSVQPASSGRPSGFPGQAQGRPKGVAHGRGRKAAPAARAHNRSHKGGAVIPTGGRPQTDAGSANVQGQAQAPVLPGAPSSEGSSGQRANGQGAANSGNQGQGISNHGGVNSGTGPGNAPPANGNGSQGKGQGGNAGGLPSSSNGRGHKP